MTGGERAYPLPSYEDDPRFTYGLVMDVAAVLEQHGYPPLSGPVDSADLVHALFRFLYSEEDR